MKFIRSIAFVLALTLLASVFSACDLITIEIEKETGGEIATDEFITVGGENSSFSEAPTVEEETAESVEATDEETVTAKDEPTAEEETTAEEEMTVYEETTAIEDGEPTAEEETVEETAPIEETTPIEDTAPIEETHPTEGTAPVEETTIVEETTVEDTITEEPTAPEGVVVIEPNKHGIIEDPVIESVGIYTYWVKVPAGIGTNGANPLQFGIMNFSLSDEEGNWLISIAVEGIDTYAIKTLNDIHVTAYPTDLPFNYDEWIYAFDITNANDRAVGVTITVTVEEAIDPEHACINRDCDDDICDICGVAGIPGAEHNMAESMHVGTGADNIFVYECVNCKRVFEKKNVPTTINKYITPEGLAIGNAYQGTSSALYDGEAYFYHLAGQDKISQHIWLRELYAHPTGNGMLAGGGSKMKENIDIGTSRYMIIKVRTNEQSIIDRNYFTIHMSTTGYNYDAEGITGMGITSVSTAVKIPVTELGEWTVVVVDLEIMREKYVPDATGAYIIDTFYLTSVANIMSGNSIDIRYIAFADNWGEIESFVDESILTSVNADGTVTLRNATGAEHVCVNSDCDVIDRKCDKCGKDGVAGVPCVNNDCNSIDQCCDVCGTFGVFGVDCIPTSCADDKCSICGTHTMFFGMHTDKDSDGGCDTCNQNLVSASDTFILTPEKLLDWSVRGTGDSVNEAGNYEVKTSTDGKYIGAYFASSDADKVGSAEGKEMNVGLGRIIVIKFRSASANRLRFHISTKAVSSTDPTSDKDGFGAFYVTTAADNDWTYYIMDAAKVIYGFDRETLVYQPNENGEYIIDTFMFEQTAINGNANFEIAYIAFAEDFDSVDALLANDADAKSVNIVTNTYTNSINGNAASNATTTKVVENVVDGKIEHTDYDGDRICDRCHSNININIQ